MSATLTPKRKSARDRPASSKERVGIGGEKAGDRLESSWSEARAQLSTWLTLPGGQYRTLVPRGPRPVLVLHLAVVVETFHVAAVLTHILRSPSARPASLLLPPAAPRRRRRASLCCSLSCAKHLRCCTYGWLVAGTCVARAHACVRYGAWAGCGAHSESTSSIALPPPRQPFLSSHKND